MSDASAKPRSTASAQRSRIYFTRSTDIRTAAEIAVSSYALQKIVDDAA